MIRLVEARWRDEYDALRSVLFDGSAERGRLRLAIAALLPPEGQHDGLSAQRLECRRFPADVVFGREAGSLLAGQLDLVPALPDPRTKVVRRLLLLLRARLQEADRLRLLPSGKTAIDFAFTEQFWGVRAVDPGGIEKRGRELWYRRDGKPTRIRRIYNRLIFDELEAKGGRLPFDLREPLDVSWAGHPNWYFRWSKHALPQLHHPTVPEAVFLSDLAAPPKDLSQWVLKPLFSFAGSGVKIDVTPEDLAAVSAGERAHTLLMRKVEYAPVIATTDGNFSKVEVRIMFAWKDGKPLPVITLARLSQGKMMGVNYNKDRTWVGSSGCLWPKG